MNLIPMPRLIKSGTGNYILKYHTYLVISPECPRVLDIQAAQFSQNLKKCLGYSVLITRGQGRKGDIVLTVDATLPREGYLLKISEDGIRITGNEGGIWYGLQTLLQIISQKGAVLPAMEIQDAPDIKERGFYFDCSRGRIPKLSWLKELVDKMAYYKLNQLQLYIEHTYLFRGMTELWRDDTPLTAEEIMELDRYCLERGIELIPSLSSFGHLYKLLSSHSYAHLCELENSAGKPFSLIGRMHHHTIDATNPESIQLIKGLIAEYMELFTSQKFNLCADETFDLGKGRAKTAVEEKGKDRVYIDFVKEIAEFIAENGRIPMFWGDIISDFPEMIHELPENIICLNWGYSPEQSEEPTAALNKAGATQYCCPGCQGWNRLLPPGWDAWQNVKRQCAYAAKYGAAGVLNTDWGDYFHINHPDFSRLGMIYGAAFSWNTQDAEDYSKEAYTEFNKKVSRLEYGDNSGEFLNIIDEANELVAFQWDSACLFWELKRGIAENEEIHKHRIQKRLYFMEGADKKIAALDELLCKMYQNIGNIEAAHRKEMKAYLVAVEGIKLFDQLGVVVCHREYDTDWAPLPDEKQLALDLETWLYDYKQVYREVSRQSELSRVESLVCWYGDYLRAPDFTMNYYLQ